MTAHLLARSLLCLVLPLAAFACGAEGPAEPDEPPPIAGAIEPLGVNGLPAGLVCGIAYTDSGQTIVEQAYCQDPYYRTLPVYGPPYAPVNWRKFFDGDYGLPAGHGFAHQSLLSGARPEDSAQLVLPRGTACGFKHSANTPSVTCMGLDPRIGCPAGWAQRSVGDADSGERYYWCEYLDWYNTCPNMGCSSQVPRGTACGISNPDEGSGVGYCNGYRIQPGYPCPNGWTRLGFYDRGRSAGHGIGWCVKL
jgi:hypothetical protein